MERRWALLVGLICGYTVGDLPDDQLGWVIVQAAFTIAVFVGMILVLIRERAIYRRRHPQ